MDEAKAFHVKALRVLALDPVKPVNAGTGLADRRCYFFFPSLYASRTAACGEITLEGEAPRDLALGPGQLGWVNAVSFDSDSGK